MALKTADYIAMGRRGATEPLYAIPELKEGSWQHKAFMVGRNTALNEAKGMSPHEASNQALGIKSGRLATEPPNQQRAAKESSLRPPGKRQPLPAGHPALAYFEGWPPAAVEHVRFLAMEIADEKSLARQNRLLRSFERISRRHKLREAFDGGSSWKEAASDLMRAAVQ
jgi:hypothetical protein